MRIIILISAFVLSGCSANDDLIAKCFQQGTYADLQNNRCAPIAPQPPPTAEQVARQADFDRRVAARAAAMATGTLEMRRMQAAHDELAMEDFCLRNYAPAAFTAVGYRDIGWPEEMTFEHMSPLVGVPVDLLIPLISAAYSNRTQSTYGFAQIASRRCMDSNPFR